MKVSLAICVDIVYEATEMKAALFTINYVAYPANLRFLMGALKSLCTYINCIRARLAE